MAAPRPTRKVSVPTKRIWKSGHLPSDSLSRYAYSWYRAVYAMAGTSSDESRQLDSFRLYLLSPFRQSKALGSRWGTCRNVFSGAYHGKDEEHTRRAVVTSDARYILKFMPTRSIVSPRFGLDSPPLEMCLTWMLNRRPSQPAVLTNSSAMPIACVRPSAAADRRRLSGTRMRYKTSPSLGDQMRQRGRVSSCENRPAQSTRNQF